MSRGIDINGDVRVACDGAGCFRVTRPYSPRTGKPVRGWTTEREPVTERVLDYCPACSRARKEEP